MNIASRRARSPPSEWGADRLLRGAAGRSEGHQLQRISSFGHLQGRERDSPGHVANVKVYGDRGSLGSHHRRGLGRVGGRGHVAGHKHRRRERGVAVDADALDLVLAVQQRLPRGRRPGGRPGGRRRAAARQAEQVLRRAAALALAAAGRRLAGDALDAGGLALDALVRRLRLLARDLASVAVLARALTELVAERRAVEAQPRAPDARPHLRAGSLRLPAVDARVLELQLQLRLRLRCRGAAGDVAHARTVGGQRLFFA
eukprot:2281911-Prymnesium_polylepis.2